MTDSKSVGGGAGDQESAFVLSAREMWVLLTHGPHLEELTSR